MYIYGLNARSKGKQISDGPKDPGKKTRLSDSNPAACRERSTSRAPPASWPLGHESPRQRPPPVKHVKWSFPHQVPGLESRRTGRRENRTAGFCISKSVALKCMLFCFCFFWKDVDASPHLHMYRRLAFHGRIALCPKELSDGSEVGCGAVDAPQYPNIRYGIVPA